MIWTHEAAGVEPRTAGRTVSGVVSIASPEPGTVLGTAGYMSPEQVRGEPVDARSDIFSFGAVLYEMLSGRRAFKGDSACDQPPPPTTRGTSAMAAHAQCVGSE